MAGIVLVIPIFLSWKLEDALSSTNSSSVLQLPWPYFLSSATVLITPRRSMCFLLFSYGPNLSRTGPLSFILQFLCLLPGLTQALFDKMNDQSIFNVLKSLKPANLVGLGTHFISDKILWLT